MRRNLIKLLLVCMILTCFSSGTLAIYNTSTVLAPVSVTAKRFFIGVNSFGTFEALLAPGEECFTDFTVTNTDSNGMPTEVNMSLCIEGDFSTLYKQLPGIRVTLTEVGNPSLQASPAENGLFAYREEVGFQKDQALTRTFRLIYSWNDAEADQAQYAGQRVDGITLYVTGTQAT